MKHDLEAGTSESIGFGPDRYGSEAPFAPRVGATEEDDGYLLSFITDEAKGTSECVIIDARKVAERPVCRIALPHKISSGTHATWANGADIRAGRLYRQEAA